MPRLRSLVLFLCLVLPVPATPCHYGCICFKTTVRCMQLFLEDIPPVSENTTVLDLRFNKIKRIQPGALSNNKHLNTLVLNDNQIQILENGVFKGLSELKHLYLYKNKIHEIQPRAFEGLGNLNQLYLHYNKIEILHPQLFHSLPKLERLFLHENKIQHIHPATFNNLTSLKRLRLDGNALVCDCGMLWFKKLIAENMQKTQVAAICQSPSYMQGKSLHDMSLKEFSCKEPQILEHPHDVEVTFGGTAMFTCRVDGDPQPEITWMLNSNEIDTSNPKYSLRPDGTLMIAPMTDRDVGVYECMAKSPFGEVKSRSAKIVYRRNSGKQQFRRRPEDQIASAGDTIQLECSVSGASEPKVTWTRDDLPVSDSRHRVSPEGTLTIQDVTTEDTGAYRCVIETLSGRVSAQAQVTVNVAPRFIIPPESQTVKSGATSLLRCYAHGSPTPVITWYKDGNSITPTDRIQFADDGSLLRVHHVKEGDAGLYTCAAQNTEGTAEASGEIRVKNEGPRPPKLIVTPYPLIAPLGASVEFPCKAQGEPKPTLTWTKNGNILIYDSNHKLFPVGSLRIYNITRSDGGLYQCKAQNENGEITAQATLTIEGLESIDDNLVIQAVEEAQLAVDRAVNSTLQTLFSKKKPQSPHMLMRLFRYPDAVTRTFVRPADIFENTLINIRRHISSGIQLNETGEFYYENLLTPEQLELIAKLSGCMEHQLPANCSDMCFHTKYRTIDGTCNNFQNPHWGASLTGFRRIAKPIYENGFSTPVGWNKQKKYFGHSKPSARLVSTTLISTDHITQDDEITHMVMQWGQFLDHDLDHAIPSTSAESWEGVDCKKSCDFSPPCYPIEIPHGDSRIRNRRCMDFIRSSAICGSGTTSIFFDKIEHREQINQLTSYIDGSQVYGYTTNRSILLRDHSNDFGLLRVGIPTPGGKYLLPLAGSEEVDCRRDPTESDVGCFLAGDIRVNEQVALVSMHTIWLREHNRVALELKSVNPHWTGETLFNEARKIIGAEMQHITYKHWLPHILGTKGMEMLGEYEGYDPNVDPAISNVFATAAFRFGHSLINPTLSRLNQNFETIPQGDLPLGKAFFSPWRVVDEGGVDPLMRGMFMTPAKRKRPRENLNNQLTEHLFTTAHAVALDLAAINIQRSRDHGLPGYNEYRKFCNLTEAKTFDDLADEITDPEVRRKLKELYGHPGNIDIWVGGILEDQVDEAKVGPTFRCILVDQFRRIRNGDRFWYENPSTFEPAQLTQIKQSSLARVLCDNGDNITQITPNVFVLPEIQNQHLVKCDKVTTVDFRFWHDCEDCENSISKRERRESETEKMESRVEGLEGVVAELQRAVRSLRRRMKQLTEGIGCRDHKGKVKRDGDTWQKDVCTLCECQGNHVTCTRLECAKLPCENYIRKEGKCCPICV